MKLADIRRERLRSLIKKHGSSELAEMLGYQHPSFLSQLAGPNPTRSLTDKAARRFQEKLGLPEDFFDTPIDQTPGRGAVTAPAAAPASGDTAIVAEVIRLVGSVCAGEQITLPPAKFADVVALAYIDTMEHNRQPRTEHIKSIVRLLK